MKKHRQFNNLTKIFHAKIHQGIVSCKTVIGSKPRKKDTNLLFTELDNRLRYIQSNLRIN